MSTELDAGGDTDTSAASSGGSGGGETPDADDGTAGTAGARAVGGSGGAAASSCAGKDYLACDDFEAPVAGRRPNPLIWQQIYPATGIVLDDTRAHGGRQSVHITTVGTQDTHLLVFGWLRRRAARRGLVGARGGSVTAIQRFGGALNANVHFHALIFDGVYTRATPTARPVFHRLPAPTDADIAALLTRLHRRVRRLLARRGRLPEEAEGSDPFATEAPLFAQTVAASLQGRVVPGPRAGQPLRRLRSAAAATVSAPRCARLDGFSLHADVAVPARRRDRLEHLVRYVLRPPLALDRLTESPGGQLLYHFRRPWSDGSTALLLDPLELLERLAALVPPPRRPLLAYHGLLAPRARWRSAIVPRPPAHDTAAAGARSPRRWPWARLLQRVFAIQDHMEGPA